jgi:hypothetical protein
MIIGEARGVEKTAIKMLKENTDIKFIATVTGISTDEIMKRLCPHDCVNSDKL